MVMKKVVGSLVGIVMMVGSCVGSANVDHQNLVVKSPFGSEKTIDFVYDAKFQKNEIDSFLEQQKATTVSSQERQGYIHSLMEALSYFVGQETGLQISTIVFVYPQDKPMLQQQVSKYANKELNMNTFTEELSSLDFATYKDCIDNASKLIIEISEGKNNSTTTTQLQKLFVKNVAGMLQNNFELQNMITPLFSDISISGEDYFGLDSRLTERLSFYEYGRLFDEQNLKYFYFALSIGSLIKKLEPTSHICDSINQIAGQLRCVVTYAESVSDSNQELLKKFNEVYEQFRIFDRDE